MESMKKYEDLFNKYFKKEDFDTEEKKQMAFIAFSKMMESLQNVQISDEMMKSLLENLDISLLSNSELFEGMGDGIIYPIIGDMSEKDEHMLENGFTINHVKIKKNNSNFIVVEEWESNDKTKIFKQKYLLSLEIFESKNNELKEMIVDGLVSKNYINNYKNIYLNSLDIEPQLRFYKKLLDQSVDNEMYEDSAMYRDIISELENIIE